MKRIVLALDRDQPARRLRRLRRRRGPTTPTVGERIPVLGTREPRSRSIRRSPTSRSPCRRPVANADWAQPGGNASKSIGHVALGDAPSQAWSVSIGAGSSARARLAAEPVVADGRVYTIDTRARVRAFNAETGAPDLASTRCAARIAPSETLFGGGVSFDNGRVYATNGAGDVAALDAATGAIVWMVKPGGPLRGAPTIANDNVYVLSQDNQLYALNAANGETRWTGAGAFELAGVFGTRRAGLRAEHGGRRLLVGRAQRLSLRERPGRLAGRAGADRHLAPSVGTLSDIDADPVIDKGRVFAVGQGGRMVAVELITGQRAWEINIAGISTPWVAGDWVFVVTDRAQLLAVARASGRIRWISQLPASASDA